MNLLSLGATVDVGAAATGRGRAQFELRIGAFVNRELEVVSFTGHEKLNAPFVYDVVFASAVPVEALQIGVFGFPACLAIHSAAREPRVIQGLAVAFEAVGAADAELKTKVRRYAVRIVPRLWLLNHSRKYRVFEDRSAIEIACAVLEEAGITPAVRLQRGEYPKTPFVYQRGETDLEFVDRVLAVAGVFYYFEHAAGFLEDMLPGGSVGVGVASVTDAVGDVASALGLTTTLVLCDRTRHANALRASSAAATAGNLVGAGLGAMGGPIADAAAAAADLFVGSPGDALAYDANGQAGASAERVFSFRSRAEVRPKKVEARDWSVAENRGVRQAEKVATATLDLGLDVSAAFDLAGHASLGAAIHADMTVDAIPIATAAVSVMEYQRDAGLLAVRDEFAARALAQLRSDRVVATGESDCRALAPGYRFTLAKHPIATVNGPYLVTEVRSSGFAPDFVTKEAPHTYRATFECVPATIDPRPKKPEPRPALGLEAATVIGPTYGDVHCDSIGRILVRFHWARVGAEFDETGEGVCWVHWLERWAGNGFGTQTLPRVGSEVIVDFPKQEGGAPVAIGQVYSRENSPPFPLPRESSKVGIRSCTIPNGAASEVSIDDNPDTNKVLVHSSGDFLTEVVRNTKDDLGGTYDLTVADERREATQGDALFTFAKDATTRVAGNLREEVGKDRLEIVLGSVNEYVEGDASRSVDGRVENVTRGTHSAVFGADSIERHLGHRTVVVAAADTGRTSSAVLQQASAALHVEGTARAYAKKKIEVASLEGFTLTCGDSQVTISKNTITFTSPTIVLAGKTVQLTATDTAAVTAKTATVAGSDSVTVSGANKATLAGQSATVVLDSNATVQGSKIKLGSGGGGPSSQAQQSTLTKVSTLKLSDPGGNPLANERVILRKGGEGADERVTVLDGAGAIDIAGNEPFSVFFPDVLGVSFTSRKDTGAAPRPYIVAQGDYLLKLATRYSFHADAVWNLAENKPLKDQGRDPDTLCPGDVLYIPETKRNWLPVTVGQVNKFIANQTRANVCIQFGRFGESWSGEAYTIEGADIAPGALDSDGKLRAKVATGVESFVILFPKRRARVVINMGHLDPANTNSGLVQRLSHLGYLPRPATGPTDDNSVHLRMAIMRLQAAHELSVTGELDAQTRQALIAEHDSLTVENPDG